MILSTTKVHCIAKETNQAKYIQRCKTSTAWGSLPPSPHRAFCDNTLPSPTAPNPKHSNTIVGGGLAPTEASSPFTNMVLLFLNT